MSHLNWFYSWWCGRHFRIYKRIHSHVRSCMQTCDFSNRSTKIGGNSSASRYSSSSPSSYGRRMVSESRRQHRHKWCRRDHHGAQSRKKMLGGICSTLFSYQIHFCPWALKSSLHSQGTSWPLDMILTPETPASPVDSHSSSNSLERQQIKNTHKTQILLYGKRKTKKTHKSIWGQCN